MLSSDSSESEESMHDEPVPRDILKRHSIVSVATRLNISPTQQAALTEAVIEESGGDVSLV